MTNRFVIVMLAVLLVGCAGSPTLPVAPAATAQPAAVPTAVRPTSPAASATPSQATVLLPAPLYLLDNGQIARIERDGKSRSLVTSETVQMEGVPPIATFGIAQSGDLAYVVGDLGADRLVRVGSRGENPRTLYSEPGHELSDIVWTPDGQQIVLRLLNNREPPDIPSGLYRLAADGGQPELLRPDDPVDDPQNPAPTISGYRPRAWAPDGSRLLVEVFSLFYDGCALAILPAAGGELLRLETASEVRTLCGEAAWSADSAAVYFLAGSGAGPTVWRGDAASGATTALAASEVLARAPYALANGAIRFFLLASGDNASFALAELNAPNAAPTTLTAPFNEQLALALWAPDGSGAVVVVRPDTAPVALRWLPVGGELIELPSGTVALSGIAWGPAQ